MQMIGSRISLISKKNIRYEGTLYSINESDATVALQSVKSYGTEGRELLDTTGASTFVPPNDVVHAYLLFRGQDIKDLHVHENQPAKEEATQPAQAAEATPTEESNKQPAPAPAATKAVASKPVEKEQKAEEKKKVAEKPAAPKKKQADKQTKPQTTAPSAPPKKVDYASKVKDGAQHTNDSKENKPQKKQQGGSTNKGGGNTKNQSMVGTGASLLNRKARGAKGDQG